MYARRLCCRSTAFPRRYTIGSADTNGYLFLVGYHEDTIYMEYQHSISDGRGFEEFIRCVLFQYLKNCGCPVENDGTVRAMDTRWTPEESADGYEQLADRDVSPEHLEKAGGVHAPAVQWEADAGEVVSEITFPFSQLHDYAKSIGVSPLSVLAPLMMKALMISSAERTSRLSRRFRSICVRCCRRLPRGILFALSICRIFRNTAICRMTRCSGARRHF